MGYVSDLRKVVGSRPLIIAGATLLALNEGNEILLIKRTDNDCWGVPGGSMELGESIIDTLKRETREEIGFDLTDFELFGIYSGPEQYYKYPNGDEVFVVASVFITRLPIKNMKIDPVEHSEGSFFEIHHLPANISPPIVPILNDLQKWVDGQD
jgi:ADP-ribose pyrophosphatase YjhB (NUDIX family)